MNLPEIAFDKVEAVLIEGDLKPLNVEQRKAYYFKICEELKLNPYTRPFDYIIYNGKLTLYPNKSCAEQLRKRDNISLNIVSKTKTENIFCVTVRAENMDGRIDESSAYLDVTNLSGQALGNSLMKTETKAKRRVTLSICGLGMTDESEWETVEAAVPVSVDFDDPKKIEENIKKDNESKAAEEKKKPKNEAPVSAAQLKNLLEKAEMIGLNRDNLKKAISYLFGIDETKSMRVWQFEDLWELVINSKDPITFEVNIVKKFDEGINK